VLHVQIQVAEATVRTSTNYFELNLTQSNPFWNLGVSLLHAVVVRHRALKARVGVPCGPCEFSVLSTIHVIGKGLQPGVPSAPGRSRALSGVPRPLAHLLGRFGGPGERPKRPIMVKII
jgi:hypothetical protein